LSIENKEKHFYLIVILASISHKITRISLGKIELLCTYCKVASANAFHLEAHAWLFQIAYEGDY
jgi:hypothetical protein